MHCKAQTERETFQAVERSFRIVVRVLWNSILKNPGTEGHKFIDLQGLVEGVPARGWISLWISKDRGLGRSEDKGALQVFPQLCCVLDKGV